MIYLSVDLHYIDPAQPLTTADEDLDDLDRDLSVRQIVLDRDLSVRQIVI